MSATWEIRQGDAIAVLRAMPPESVQCVVTSPPYFGLRAYAGAGDAEIGREQTVAEYVQRLVDVFEEVRRVLRPDGTLWLNLGDSYAGSGKGQHSDGRVGRANHAGPGEHVADKVPGLKSKDLIGRGAWRSRPGRGCLGRARDAGEERAEDLIGIPWRPGGVGAPGRGLVAALGHHMGEAEPHAGERHGPPHALA